MLQSISTTTGDITAVAFSQNLEPLPIYKVEDKISLVKMRENHILIGLDDHGELFTKRLQGGQLQDDPNIDIIDKIMDKYHALNFNDLAMLYGDGGPTTFNGLTERSLSKIWRAVNLFKAAGMVKAFSLGTKSVEVPFHKVTNEWRLAKDFDQLSFNKPTDDTYFICWTKSDRAKIYGQLKHIPNGVYKIAKVNEGVRHVSWELFIDKNKFSQMEGL